MPRASMHSVGARLSAVAHGGEKTDFGVPGAPLTERTRTANEQHLAFSTNSPKSYSGDSFLWRMVAAT